MSLLLSYWAISSQELCNEAEKLWLEVEIISKEKNLFYISSSGKKVLFKSTDFWWNTSLWYKLCLDKWLTYDILERHWLPTAKSIYLWKDKFSSFQKTDISHMRFPLVIKPLDDGHGNWVMMNIESFFELQEKLKKSFQLYNNMIVQEQIEGDEIRVLVVKWEVVIAINRIPTQVLWDGISNLKELIEVENKNPLRGEWYDEPLSYIKVDDEMLSFLSKSKKDLDYVPKKDEVTQLRWNSNLWTWWTLRDVTHILSKKTKDICCKAAKVLGLEISGVDIIMTDLSQDLDAIWWIILEVWATPGIWGHKQLTKINSAQEILKKVFSL